MLYLIADWLGFPGVINLFRYLSFRSGGAVATALLIALIIGPRSIGWLGGGQGGGTAAARQRRPADDARADDSCQPYDRAAAVDGPRQPLCLGVHVRDLRVRDDRLPRR